MISSDREILTRLENADSLNVGGKKITNDHCQGLPKFMKCLLFIYFFLGKLKNKKENGESRTIATVWVVKVNCGQGRTA